VTGAARQRVDLWLYRARLAKTRAAAARLISEGGVRLMQAGVARRLEKSSAEVGAGDSLVFMLNGKVVALQIQALGSRRGPPAEARSLYSEVDADGLA